MMSAFMETMRMIKIEHSIFALPFAMVSAFWAAQGMPALGILGLIVLAMVLARSAAMAFNRWLDADIDAANPRTAIRSIPAGRLSSGFALTFTIVCSAALVLTCFLAILGLAGRDKVREVLADLAAEGTALPALTMFLFNRGGTLMGSVILLTIGLLVLANLTKSRAHMIQITLIGVLFNLVTAATVAVGLFLPLKAIMESL